MTERPLWTPDSAAVTSSALWRFMQPLGLRSFDEVLRFSVDQPEDFWRAVWDFCEVKAETRGARVLIDGDT
jgi:acetoacetyl-CoA synthetase